MATLEDFKPYIRPEVPGCPEPLLEQYIKRTIERFCRETWIWQEDQDLSIIEDQKEYTIDQPDGTTIVDVVSVTTDTDSPVKNFIWNSVESKLVFQDKPNKDATWTVKLALKPAKGIIGVTWQGDPVIWQGEQTTYSSTYKDFLIEDWAETIAYGTLWHLLALRQQPFFNGELSQVYGQYYVAKESKAKVEANRLRHGKRDLQVKPQPFV